MPAATPVLETVSPSFTAWTIATANIAPPLGTSPYRSMNVAPSSRPTVPTRNGPTRWARRPPAAPKMISGRANSEMPRLEIHTSVSRSSSTTAHSASKAPIISQTAQPITTAPANGPDAQQVDGEALAHGDGGLGDGRAGDERQRDQRRRGDDQERRRDAERVDEQRRHGGTGGEPADVDGDQAPEVVAQPIGVGEDHDAADRRDGHPDADPHHEAPGEERHDVGGDGHQHEPGDVQQHARRRRAGGRGPGRPAGRSSAARGTRRRTRCR